jgi:hypothetical protein
MREEPQDAAADTPPETIVRVDCGGTCHLLTRLDPEDPVEPGDVLQYRCPDCLERFDVVYETD